jgi:membrane protease YdiL (CAAX protease family)
MSSTTPSRSAHRQHGRAPIRFVRRRPVLVFCLLAFGLGWPLLTLHTVTTTAHTTLGHLFTYGVLLGSAVLVTRIADGPGGVGRLLRRLLLWRFHPWRWLIVLLSIPALTAATAAAAGTLSTPAGGWPAAGTAYLFATVTGALLVNLAEETAWAGMVQTRLAARHGLLQGALLTAPLFAAMHLPLQFTPGWTLGSVAIGTAALILVAPVFRYVVGDLLEGTGGSLLAVGLWHASFNASGQFGSGRWEILIALVVLAAGLAIRPHVTRPTSATPLA